MRESPFETMDRLLEQFRRDMWDVDTGYPRPRAAEDDLAADLAERDGDYVFTADLPGFERDEIDLRFHDGDLVLSAVHDEDDASSARHRSVSERVTLPKAVDEDAIEATYRNGVLTVTLPVVAGADEAGHRIDID